MFQRGATRVLENEEAFLFVVWLFVEIGVFIVLFDSSLATVSACCLSSGVLMVSVMCVVGNKTFICALLSDKKKIVQRKRFLYRSVIASSRELGEPVSPSHAQGGRN